MKRYISTIYIRLIALIVIMTLSAGAVVGQTVEDYSINDFNGWTNWSNFHAWFQDGRDDVATKASWREDDGTGGKKKIVISNSYTSNFWEVQYIVAIGFSLEANKTYTIQLKAKAANDVTAHMNIHNGLTVNIPISSTLSETTVEITPTATVTQLLMQTGDITGEIEIEEIKISHINPTTLDGIFPIVDDYVWAVPYPAPSWAPAQDSKTTSSNYADSDCKIWIYNVHSGHFTTKDIEAFGRYSADLSLTTARSIKFKLPAGVTKQIIVHYRALNANSRGVVLKVQNESDIVGLGNGSDQNHLVIETLVTTTEEANCEIIGNSNNAAYLRYIEIFTPIYASTSNPGNDNYWWQWANGSRAYSIDIKQNEAYDMKNRLHVFTDGGTYNQSVIWSLVSGENNCGATITEDGLVTATGIGKAKVRATLKTSASETRDIDVEITSRKGENPTLSGLKIYTEDKEITGTTIVHNVPYDAPAGENNKYKMRITPSTSTTDVFVNNTKLTKVTNEEYFEYDIYVLETPGEENIYTIRLDDGYGTSTGILTPHYETTYTVKIIREAPASYSVDLQSVKVGGEDITTNKTQNVYTFKAPANTELEKKYSLTIEAESSSATVTVAGPFRAMNERGGTFAAPSTVVLPNIPGLSNYYSVQVVDHGQTGWYWVEVMREPTEGELKVIGREIGWTTSADGYRDWSASGEISSGSLIVQDGYIKLHSTGKKIKLIGESGLYFAGRCDAFGNPNKNNCWAEIKVSEKGVLRIRTNNGSNTTEPTSNNDQRGLAIQMPNADGTGYVNVDPDMVTVYTGTGIQEVRYDNDVPTSIFLYATTQGMSINDLIWIPDAQSGEMFKPEINLTSSSFRVESGESLTDVFATASYFYGDLTDKLVYNITEGGDLINQTSLSPDSNNKITLTSKANVSGTVKINVSLSPSNDYETPEPKTITVDVYAPVVSADLNKLTIGSRVWTGNELTANIFEYSAKSDTLANSSLLIGVEKTSSKASVWVSPALRATTSAPENLSYSAYTEQFNGHLPEAPGFSNYYYIKVTEGSETKYYCIRLHRKAGTGELEVWDREMGWTNESDSYGDWEYVRTITDTRLIQDQTIRVYMDACAGRGSCNVSVERLYFLGGGNFGNNNLAHMVAEIKVSGKGKLKVKASIDTNANANFYVKYLKYDATTVKGEIADLKTITVSDELTTIDYNDDIPTSIYLYSSKKATDISQIIWTPSDTPQDAASQPEFVWEGTQGFIYGSRNNKLRAKVYQNGAEIENVEYYVVADGVSVNCENNSELTTGTDKYLNFSGFATGTVTIMAVAGGGKSFYTFNVERQLPMLTIPELKTYVGETSTETILSNITVSGLKLLPNGTLEEESITGTGLISYTASTDKTYYDVENDKIKGNSVGRGDMTIKWEAGKRTKNTNYRDVTVTADVIVIDKNLEMVFRKSAGTGGCGRPYQADVICRDKDTKTTIKGLKIKYEIITDGFPDDVSAELNADGTAVIPGNISGTIHIKAYFGRDPKATDKNAYYDNADTGTTKYFTLTTKKIGTLTEITENSFESLNLADLIWNNETRSTGVGKEISLATAPKFMTDNYYFAKANSDVEDHDANHHHFRFYPANNDELVNSPDSPIKGLYMKSKDSYLSFYAEGSATLELQGYASVARSVEVWAVSDADWKDYADPQLNDGAVKVAIIEIPEGEFPRTEGEKTISAETEIELPGANYYFIKTNNGGIYLSKVIWKNKKEAATLTVNRNRYELTSNSDIISVMNGENGDNIIHPFVITAKKGTEEISDPEFKFSSSDESIATVNSKTGVVNPINQSPLNLDGTTRKPVTIYIDMEAGDDYAAARTGVDIIIKDKVADVFFGNGLSEISVVYAKKTNTVLSADTETGGTWLTPTIRDAETKNTLSSAAYNLEYRLEDMNGDPYTKAKIDKKTGVVTIINGATFSKDEKFRVVVKFTSDMYVNQQAYYVVKVADALTDPAVTYDSEDGMKELNRSNYDGAWGTSVWGFYKQREYFIPAEHDAKLTFTLPEPLNGLTMHAKILDNLADAPPITDFEFESETGKNSMIVTIPVKTTKDKNNRIISYDYQVKYVWLRITRQKEDGTGSDFEDYTNIWNGAYKITFFAQPSFSVDGTSAAGSTRKVTLTSNNPRSVTTGYYDQVIYSTTDSSTPTAESRKYTDTPISHTSNAVYNVVEAFVPSGGFTDGTTTFTTSVLYNQEVEILDNNVIEVVNGEKYPKLQPNWNNQLLLPKGATASSAELRVMMGTRGAHIFYPSGDLDGQPDDSGVTPQNRFKEGGARWDEKGKDHDPGIPFYVDIYKYYKQGSDAQDTLKIDGVPQKENDSWKITKKYDSNPYTEYNGDFGGKGTHYPNSSAALKPYMTPISGAFFRFEPEYSGVVTVWIRQNGASASSAWTNSHDDKTSNDATTYNLTRRPVFIMDEDGRQLERNTAAYSSSWQLFSQYKDINGTCADVSIQSTLDADFMWGWNNYSKGAANRHKTSLNAMAFYKEKYGFYVDYDIDENGVGYVQKFRLSRADDETDTDAKADGPDMKHIPITDLVYCDNEDDVKNVSFVQGGFETPMPNYVRYRFPVTAGKTYFMGGRQTKNSFCAVKFDRFVKNDGKTPIDVEKDIEIDDDSDDNASEFEELKTGDVINCTLKRTFTAGYWHPIVLPFSVSETRMREIFGDEVMVLTLDSEQRYDGTDEPFTMPNAVKTISSGNIDDYNEKTADLVFTKHFYQMLYANTPAFIKPTFKWYKREKDSNGQETVIITTDTNGDPNPKYNDPFNSDAKTTITQKTCVNFNRVTYVEGGPKTVSIGHSYFLKGTYDKLEGHKGDIYYLTNEDDGSKAVIRHNNSTQYGVTFKATRCWIERSTSSTSAPTIKRVGITTFDGMGLNNEANLIATDIHDVFADVFTSNPGGDIVDWHVYNLQGIAVDCVTEERGIEAVRGELPAGIYVFQGKKMLIR